ncbi:MAG: hypothetical protein KUG77_18840, partial [Nannocystaceae bacterium]|nr:hypothetical protein [Nannocystaceae bacterium]
MSPAMAAEAKVLKRVGLTPGQEAMWFHQGMDPQSRALHIPKALRVSARIDPAVFESAVARVVDLHPALRLRFGRDDEAVFQVVHARGGPLDLRAVEAERSDVERLLQEDARELFDLEKEPPVRFRLYNTPDECFILICAHHV